MPLTISRKPGEAVVVDGPCTIRVSPNSHFSRVRLLITAPPEVLILREELSVLDPKGHVTDRDLRDAGIGNHA